MRPAVKQPLRQTSLIGIQASACLRNPMICSSVNLLFFMSVILLVDGLHEFYVGTAGGGQVTKAELDITKPRTMPVLGWDFDRTKRICVWYV
jgi:hypothetical protein